MKMSAAIRIALVGAGKWMESHHLPVLQRLKEQWPVEFIGIWNRTREKSFRLATLFGIPKVYDQLQDLVMDPEPNCRVVVVDKEAVYSILLELQKNPLPFLCEKPPGQTLSQAKILAYTIRVPHVLAFNRRYAPLYNQLRTFLLQPGYTPYWVECSFYRRARQDPHMVVESGIHGINFLEYLLGPVRAMTPLPLQRTDIPSSVDQNSATDLNPIPERIQLRAALVEFQSGAKGLLKFFPCTGKALEWYEFQGREYSAYLRMKQPFLDEEQESLSIFQHKAEGVYVHPLNKKVSAIQDPFIQQGFVGEYEEFFQIVLNPACPSRSNFQNGWSSLAIAEAIEQGIEYHYSS